MNAGGVQIQQESYLWEEAYSLHLQMRKQRYHARLKLELIQALMAFLHKHVS